LVQSTIVLLVLVLAVVDIMEEERLQVMLVEQVLGEEDLHMWLPVLLRQPLLLQLK
jgi:hypothetical protein